MTELDSSFASRQDSDDDNCLRVDVSRRIDNFLLQAAFSAPAQGITALFGPSGCGKTSLLRLIAGLDRPDQGQITLGGQTLTDSATQTLIPPAQRRCGVVFQEPRLFPHYRVESNLRYGMRHSLPGQFEDVVRLLGLQSLLRRYPATLSGGEARRVAIGRALLSAPQILLLDEPLSGLDGARRQELLHYLQQLRSQLSIPILYVSHDPEELTAIADHLIVLNEGQVIASGALETLLLRFDLTRYLGGFDAASVVNTRVVAHDTEFGLTELQLGDGQSLVTPLIDAASGSMLRVRIPVREVALARHPCPDSSYRNQLRAVIDDFTILPDSPSAVECHLRLGKQSLRARLTRKSWQEMGLQKGEHVIALVRTVAFPLKY